MYFKIGKNYINYRELVKYLKYHKAINIIF